MDPSFIPVFVVEDVVEAVREAAREVGVLRESAGASHRERVRQRDSGDLLTLAARPLGVVAADAAVEQQVRDAARGRRVHVTHEENANLACFAAAADDVAFFARGL